LLAKLIIINDDDRFNFEAYFISLFMEVYKRIIILLKIQLFSTIMISEFILKPTSRYLIERYKTKIQINNSKLERKYKLFIVMLKVK
jgi:hypothetical protein